MHDLFTTVTNYLQAHWPTILALLGGGAGVSVLLETLLAKLHINSKKVAYTLLHFFAIATTAATYFLANLKGYDTLPVYATLVIFAQTWHRFAVSPAYNKYIVPYLQYLENKQPAATSTVAPTPELPEEPNEFTT